jgi:hypothetical protein
MEVFVFCGFYASVIEAVSCEIEEDAFCGISGTREIVPY